MTPVFADRWLLVVDKPAGLATQATRAGEPGLYDQLQAHERYLGLHHRLDQPASGLVLFTRDKAVNGAIAAGFRDHTIARTYLAVLWGGPLDDRTTWDVPLDGKRARTHVTVLGRDAGLSACRVVLETGRLHQIRRHAAMAGHPILGDRRYGGQAGRELSRLALHAAGLGLEHPRTHERLDLRAPLPDDLREAWVRAGGPENEEPPPP